MTERMGGRGIRASDGSAAVDPPRVARRIHIGHPGIGASTRSPFHPPSVVTQTPLPSGGLAGPATSTGGDRSDDAPQVASGSQPLAAPPRAGRRAAPRRGAPRPGALPPLRPQGLRRTQRPSLRDRRHRRRPARRLPRRDQRPPRPLQGRLRRLGRSMEGRPSAHHNRQPRQPHQHQGQGPRLGPRAKARNRRPTPRPGPRLP